ncbi:sulfotransferase domain-containing protein [Halovulum sp. GXIMD14793]
MQPFVFFSYGMTKCGSTLAFQLARTALLQAGMDQPQFDIPGLFIADGTNAVEHITLDQAKALHAEVQRLGHPLALKTHTRPDDPAVVGMIQSGAARAHAVIRDPRDMALSMLDHGREAREEGRPAFAEIVTLDDAMTGIDNQLDSLSAWMQLPGVSVMKYDRLAFDTAAAATDILGQLGITGDPQKIATHVLRREFTQKNVGIRDRHKTQMRAADNARFVQRYAPFYDLLLGPDTPGRLPPATSLTAV